MKKRDIDKDLSYKVEFETFFREYFKRLYCYAMHMIKDEEICKDIVTESFVYLWEKRYNINFCTAVPYMYKIVNTRCIDYLRHSKIKEEYKVHTRTFFCDETFEEIMEREKRIQEIMLIMEEFPEKTRFIFHQCYLNKKKYSEVSKMTGLSESGVRKHIMKGLTIIRKHFSVKYKKNGN